MQIVDVDVYKDCQWNGKGDGVCFLWIVGQCFYYNYCQDCEDDYYDYKVGYQCQDVSGWFYFFFNQFVK